MNGIDIRSGDGVLVVAPSGDIDLTNAGDLRAAVLAALPDEGDAVIVDLTATRYLDSAGVRVLFSIARRLEERRRRFAVVARADAPVRRVLTIVDIESRATLHESIEAARESVAAEPAEGRG